MTNIPRWIIVHHTGGTDLNPLCDTSNQTFDVVDEYHRKKWNFRSSLGYYLGYHYYIDKSGKLTQARLDDDEGAHTIGMNLDSIGICLAGNFDLTEPTLPQIETLKTFIRRKMSQYDISIENVVPHRHFANKTCYGRNLKDNWVKTLLNVPITQQCAPERDIIEQQVKKINLLQSLINSIIKFFNIK